MGGGERYFFEDCGDILVGLWGGAGFGAGGGKVGEDFVVGEDGGLGFDDLEGFVLSASALRYRLSLIAVEEQTFMDGSCARRRMSSERFNSFNSIAKKWCQFFVLSSPQCSSTFIYIATRKKRNEKDVQDLIQLFHYLEGMYLVEL